MDRSIDGRCGRCRDVGRDAGDVLWAVLSPALVTGVVRGDR